MDGVQSSPKIWHKQVSKGIMQFVFGVALSGNNWAIQGGSNWRSDGWKDIVLKCWQWKVSDIWFFKMAFSGWANVFWHNYDILGTYANFDCWISINWLYGLSSWLNDSPKDIIWSFKWWWSQIAERCFGLHSFPVTIFFGINILMRMNPIMGF